MSLPIRVAIIAPADKPWPMPESLMRARVMSYMQRLKNWVRAEVGCTFDYELYYLRSKYDHLTLATEDNGNIKIDPADGKGGDEGQIWNRCFREELGLKSEIEGVECVRWIAIVNHFGGWAGGRNNQPAQDVGTALVGDRCIYPHPDLPFSHEVTHLFGVSSHVGNLLPDLSTVTSYLEPFRDGNLTVAQKGQLITRNYRFLRDI